MMPVNFSEKREKHYYGWLDIETNSIPILLFFLNRLCGASTLNQNVESEPVLRIAGWSSLASSSGS